MYNAISEESSTVEVDNDHDDYHDVIGYETTRQKTVMNNYTDYNYRKKYTWNYIHINLFFRLCFSQ